MTKGLKTVILTASFVLATSVGATAATKFCDNSRRIMPYNTQVADAAYKNVYDMLTPSIIEFYENNISKQPVVSNIRPNKLKRMADKLSVTQQKYKAILILQDLAAKTGDAPDIKTLAGMSDGELIKCAKKYFDAYKATLSPDEIAQLKNKFKEIKK